MAPSLGMYTYQFGDNGFQLNTDYNGTLPFFDVDSISGLDGAPPRVNSADRTMRDGSIVNAGFMTMRTIVVTGTLYTNSNDPDTVLDRLRAEYGPTRTGLPTPYGLPQYSPTAVQPFYFQHPGKNLRFIMCQGGGAQYVVDTGRRIGVSANVQLTLLAADPYIYDATPSDFTSSANTNRELNTNAFFETGVTPWTTVNSSTIVQSSTVAHEGYYALRMNGNGTVAAPTVRSEQTIAVLVGSRYQASTWVYSPSAWATGVQIAIRWYTSGAALISTSSGTVTALSAATWTNITVTATAPATAAFASVDLIATGTPASGQFFYWDESKFIFSGGASFPFSFTTNFGGGLAYRPTVSVSNGGTHTAYPFFTIYGPIKNPQIDNSLNSQTMPFNITLSATDVLLVDTRNRMIILQSGGITAVPPRVTVLPFISSDILVGTNFQDPFVPMIQAKTKYTIRNARASLNGQVFFALPAGVRDTYTLTGSGTNQNSRFRVTLYNTYY